MLYRYLWTEGKLHLSLGQSTIQHDDLMFQVVQKLGHYPRNFVGGDYVPDDISLVSRKWESGITPDESEIRYLIERELDNGRDQIIRESVIEMIDKTSADVEDTEPEKNFGFMKDPHDELYPPAFRGEDKIPSEVAQKLKSHVLDSIATEYKDADEWIYFTVYGSGISFNWDEEGDFDIQMWLDYSKFQDNDTPVTADDLLADVRRLTQKVNFPSFAELGLKTEDSEGKMLIQYYPKLGTGSAEENLSSKPYACYDLETSEWLYHPKPITPKFYGEAFLLCMPKAQDIAVQAESALDELSRETVDWQFWYAMYRKYKEQSYREIYEEAKRKAEGNRLAVKNLFDGVFQGRAEAYAPGGEGIEDERDAVQKLLEVWGIFQKLKHAARAKLPWEEQEIPEDDIADVIESHWKFAMAEHTGDPQLDALIEQFMSEESEYLMGGETDPENRMDYRKPEDAEGECAEVTQFFVNWMKQHGVSATLHDPDNSFSLSEKGLNDAMWRGEPINTDDPDIYHTFATITMPSGEYSVDFTASQFGYKEFPMVQKLDGDQWQREWTSKTADWNEVMDKARRYMQEGRVQMHLNTLTHAVATVEGDTGTYQTEIWRDDPNSDAITLWNCTCPWGEVSWGRTRKWKKYEGRPCAHATAVQWVSRSGTFPIQQEPEQQEQMTLPGLSPYTPVGPIDPSQLPQPPQQRNLAEPVPVPGGPNMLDQAQQDQLPAPAPPPVAPPPPIAPPPPPPLPPSRLTQPGEGGQLTLPGTFTHWERSSRIDDWIKESWFDNGDKVKTKQPVWGQDDRGADYIVPKGMKGEVLWSDADETIVIFSINSGPFGPHNVKVIDDTDLFYIDPRGER